MRRRGFLAAGLVILLLMAGAASGPAVRTVIGPGVARGASYPTLTAYNVTPSIGTDETEFTFHLEYFDQDNEAPAAEYPRVYVYSDVLGGALYKDGYYVMDQTDPMDTNFTDGKMYKFSFLYDEHEFLADGTDFSYKYVIKSQGEPTTVESPLRQGPIVDWTPMAYRNNTIDQTVWHISDSVPCAIILDDGQGSGVDGKSIRYRYARGNDSMSRWFNYKAMNDALQIPVNVDQVFHEGDQNYFQWLADDLAGTGPVASDIYRVKVDKTGVEFKDPDPPMGTETDQEYVDFQVTVTDTDLYNINHGINVSGVNGSTIEYRIRYPGNDWGGWNYTGLVALSETSAEIRYAVRISNLKVGANYIQFRGSDRAGNPQTYSDEYSVVRKNNAPLAPTWIKPNSTAETRPRITWGPGSDPDGDELEYFVQIGIAVQKDYIFSWRSTGTDLFYDLEQDLKRYVTYVVQVKAFDGRDHSQAIEAAMNITGSGTNVPPSPPSNITTVLTDVNPYICWEPSYDPDSGNLSYYIRMGTEEDKGDVFNWSHVPLSCIYQLPRGLNITQGIFHIEVQAFDGEGYSDIARATLKVVSFDIYIEDFDLNLTPGAEFEYSLKVLNKAPLSDNVTFRFNGSLFRVAGIYVNSERYDADLDPGVEYFFEANELRDLWVRFEVPKDTPYGNYTFNIYAYSENGELSGVLEKDYADVLEPRKGPPKDERTWDELCAAYWWLLVLIAAAVMIALNVAYYIIKKRRGAWHEEDEEDHEYMGGGKEEEEEEPPPTPDDEAEEGVEVESIKDGDLEGLDDLLEPPPDGLELPDAEPPPELLPGITPTPDEGMPGDGAPPALPPHKAKRAKKHKKAPEEPEEPQPEVQVEVPTIDVVCTLCGGMTAVDVTVDPRTLPCPQCKAEGTLSF